MIYTDEDALLCDMAETYHIYDLESLPVSTIAVLACGLREDSRIMMKLSGQEIALNALLLANAVDYLALLVWAKTKDGRDGKNRPESLAKALSEPKRKKKKEVLVSFTTPEEFMRARDRVSKAV